MTDSIGTAALRLTVDTEEFELRVLRAKNMAAGLGESAEKSFAQTTGAVRNAAAAYLRYGDNVGLAADQQRKLAAIRAGVPTELIDAASKRIEEYRQKVELAELAQKRFAEDQAFEKQLHEAAKLNQANEYVRFWTNALEEADAAQSRLAANKAFIASLQQQALAAKHTRVELLEMKAAEMGVAAEAAPFLEALKAQERQVQRNAIVFNEYGISAKQTQLALRQVPAQITDIFVSLQGGQNPLTVILQQGGQLRDLFGGIRPAVTALANGMRALVTPTTAALAAIAGLVALEVAAENQMQRLHASLILTGRGADFTTDELMELAEQLDRMNGVTETSAQNTLAAIAGVGVIAERNFGAIAAAAEKMKDATGKAIEETVAEYAQLARDPISTALKLNEAENFLTDAILSRAEALVRAGKIEEAADLISRERAKAQEQRADEIVKKLGLVGGAWHGIKNEAGEAWDGALQFFVNLDRYAGDAVKQLGRVKDAFSMGGPAGAFALRDALTGGPTPTLPDGSDAAAEEKRRINAKAREEFLSLEKGNRSKEQIQKDEEEQIKNLGKSAGVSQKRVDDLLAASRARYQESLKQTQNQANVLERADAKARLQAFADALAQEQGLIQNQRQVMAAEYAAKLLTSKDYYEKSRALLVQDTAAQERALLGQISVLKSRDVTGKDAIDTARELHEAEMKLAKVRADGATALVVLGVQEKDLERTRQNAIDAYTKGLDQQTAALGRSVLSRAQAVVMSQKEFERTQEIADLYQRGADEIAKLEQDRTDRPNESAEIDRKIDAARKAMDAQVAIVEEGYARMDEAQQNWLAGVRSGVQDWIDASSNVAAQTRAIAVGVMQDSTNAIHEWATTGKFEMKGLLADWLSQISKFMIQQAVLKFGMMFLDAWSGGTVGSAPSSGFASSFGNNTDWLTPNAKGGVYNSPSLHQYANQVHSSPRLFQFAKGGAFGVFGEAGSEAIMPLAKDGTGTLGVRMFGGGGGAQVTINIITNVEGSGASTQTQVSGDDEAQYRKFAEHMKNLAYEEIQKQMRPGGLLWRVGVSA